MASVQDRLKLKRVPYDTWSTREQLCLAASVLNSGENVQNWKVVSESLKPFAEKEALRPPDWFSQKSCAIQYSHLLETADIPKRKKRESTETQAESIVNRLTQERIAELKQILAFQRDEYQQLKAEVNLLKCGPLSDEKLQKMWQVIEQEEREQEQKARAHAAWLAKRQQKQDSPVQHSITLPRKPGELSADNNDVSGIDSSNNDEEEKKRGGRSPLLTSLLKSTSPTTQVQQTPPTLAQTGSPTIASLLVSSPKVPSSQLDRSLPQNVSAQLQQRVSTAIATVASERPSAGAPTLSILLELPANPQRGPLPNLQASTAAITQPSVPPEIHSTLPSITPTTSHNAVKIVQPPPAPVSQNNTITENMVQIIDHNDEVIGKDIMTDVIDKDEINEIIGDIEELIKKEITASPRTNETLATVPVVENMTVEPSREPISERILPRNVDEPISTSDSPASEMAIEDIDSSTSNIAEIIGTVAVEPTESRITAPCELPKSDEKIKADTDKTIDEDISEEESLPEESPNSPDDEDETLKKPVLSPKTESKECESNESTLLDTKDSQDQNKQLSSRSAANEDVVEEENDLTEDEKYSTCDTEGEKKEITKESEIKDEQDEDQLETHLSEITGDPNRKSEKPLPADESCEAVNEVITSVEDTEKSQDISLILEDEESSQSSQNKDKVLPSEVQPDALDTSESCPEESNISTEEECDVVVKVETAAIVAKDSTDDLKERVEEVIENEEKKEEENDSTKPAFQQTDGGDDEVSRISTSDSNHSTGSETVLIEKQEAGNIQDVPNTKDISTESKINVEEESKINVENIIDKEQKEKVEIEIKKEPITVNTETKIEENGMSEIKPETKETLEPELVEKIDTPLGMGDDGDLDEEESSLSKLSGGRTMKTYSKRQAVTIDSEPENEGGGEGADYRAWKKAVMLVFNRLVTHKYASVFLRPITEDQAPGYHSVIFRPMDLSTIKKNIDNGTIRSTMHFQRDVMLMFQNAIMYNKQDTFVYKMAVSMQEECLQNMQILVQVTGEGPFRRETRTAASSSGDFGESSAKQQRKRSHITPSPHDSDSPRTKKRRKSEND